MIFNDRLVVNFIVSDQCPQGFTSSDGYPPCTQCPKNAFWIGSTSCATCATGEITLITGAVSNSSCRGMLFSDQLRINKRSPDLK